MSHIELYKRNLAAVGPSVSTAVSSSNSLILELESLSRTMLGMDDSLCAEVSQTREYIRAATNLEKGKRDKLTGFGRSITEFETFAQMKDMDAASCVRKRKKDFYEKYSYLKPDTEKNWWEKTCEGFKNMLKKAGEWCKDFFSDMLETLAWGLKAVVAMLAIFAGLVALIALAAVILTNIGPILLFVLKVVGIALISATLANILTYENPVLDGKTPKEDWASLGGSDSKMTDYDYAKLSQESYKAAKNGYTEKDFARFCNENGIYPGVSEDQIQFINMDSGLSAIVIKGKDGRAVVVYVGTDDWLEDGYDDLMNGLWTSPQEQQAQSIVKQLEAEGYRITTAGHSLGGHLAVSANQYSDSVDKTRAYDPNGRGFLDRHSTGNEHNIREYTTGSIVSFFGYHINESVIDYGGDSEGIIGNHSIDKMVRWLKSE